MKHTLLLVGILLIVSCSQNRSSPGGFYSYVDAQGNVVVLESPPAPADSETETESGKAASVSRPALESLEGEALGEQAEFASDEVVQQRIEELQRDRFISYTDVSGYQVTAPVDVVSERKARENAAPDYQALDERTGGFIERMEGVPANCCVAVLERAEVLRAGLEQLVSFDAPWDWVTMPARHPAAAIRLDPAVKQLRFQTFLSQRGYLHPQAVFLNGDGEPMLLVDNLFTRHYPQTWYRFAYLEGDVPVEQGAVWLVLYLGYAGEDARARPVLVPGQYYWAEPSSPLSLKGELVVRGLER